MYVCAPLLQIVHFVEWKVKAAAGENENPTNAL